MEPAVCVPPAQWNVRAHALVAITMKIEFLPPRPELKKFVHKIWVFESPVGMPASDANLAAPNGCPKLILNCKNSIISSVVGKEQNSREHGLYFIGTRDCSALLRTRNGKTSFIGIEFYPYGAYPVFGIPMSETANRLWLIEDVFDRWGRDIAAAIHGLETLRDKADLIQNRLAAMLARNQLASPLVEYCVSSLRQSNGLMTINELERKTGYSRRYLEMIFKNHVGLSPKGLAGIFRFQRFYRRWIHPASYDDIKDELYDYYYDQAHFAKEFKRMTGFSPERYRHEVTNEFGRRLLRD